MCRLRAHIPFNDMTGGGGGNSCPGDEVLFSCCGGADSALGALLFFPDLEPLAGSNQHSKPLRSWHPCELNGKAILFLFDKIAATASISVDNAPQASTLRKYKREIRNICLSNSDSYIGF